MHDRTLQARRRVNTSVSRFPDYRQHFRFCFRRQVGHIILGEVHPDHRRRFQRKGLCRPQLIAWNVGRRHGPLLDRKHRLALDPVEHERQSHLAHLHHGVKPFPAVSNRDQRRLARQVVVPHIVVRGLEVPDALPGRGVQCQNAVGEQVHPFAVAAVVIEGRTACGSEHQPALGVDAHPAPVIGTAGPFPGIALPRVMPKLAGLGNGMENPAPLAAARIETPDVAGRRRFRPLADAAAADQDVLVDYRGAAQAGR